MAARRALRIVLRAAVPSRFNAVATSSGGATKLQQPAPSSSILHEFFSRNYAKYSRKDDEDDDDAYVDPSTRPDVQTGPRLNRAITNRFIRLVTPEGHKVVTRQEALDAARQQELDLVEVDPKSDPIVCKLMDYKLERYREKMREKERKKTTADTRRLNDMKELHMSNKIDDRDMEMKADQASKFIQKGHRLKCVIKVLVKGSKADDEAKANRDYKTDPRASKLMNKLIDLLKDVAKIESGPQVERHQVWAILRPLPQATPSKPKRPKKSGDEAAAVDDKPQENKPKDEKKSPKVGDGKSPS